MKKIALLSLLVAVALVATSCDQGLFGTNYFSIFEGDYDMPNLATANADDLIEAAEDERFYDGLDDLTEAEVDGIVTTLVGVANDIDAPADDRMDAALVASEVEIQASGADAAVQNVNDLVIQVINDPESINFDEPVDIIGQIFTAGATTTDVAKQLEGLFDAVGTFETYGSLLATNEPPADVNAGDVAAKALLSGMVAAMVNDMTGGSTDEAVQDAAIATIADTIVNEPENLPLLFDFTDEPDFQSLIGPEIYAVVDDGIGLEALGI